MISNKKISELETKIDEQAIVIENDQMVIKNLKYEEQKAKSLFIENQKLKNKMYTNKFRTGN